MDQPTTTAALGTTAQPVAAPAVARPVPVIPRGLPSLMPGTTIEATVLEAGQGRARLQWQGILFEALADLPLEPGRTYALLVTAVQPQLTLSAGRAVPDAALAMAQGQLGAASNWLAPLEVLLSLEAGADRNGATGDKPALEFRSALAAWASGKPAAGDLAAIHRLLGHDQEARVLRLPEALSEPREVTEQADLRRTQKAHALRLLDEPALVPERVRAARELVTGLGHIERDNADRKDQGAPLWLPLPAAPDQGLRDARMFLMPASDRRRSGGRGADAAFTVVLLLDLSRLGELRVDLSVRGPRIDATFTAVRPATVHRLQQALPGLRAAMEQGGLHAGDLRAQPAPGERLPVADLVRRRSDDALVDVHA